MMSAAPERSPLAPRFLYPTPGLQPRNDPVNQPTRPGQTLASTLPEGDWLAPADGHRVWWCQGGEPQGVPVLIVHGGPGGASRVEPTRWFDGLEVRWIAIDQRGCGRSTPLGETAANTLAGLLHDMERLRERLALPRWALAGGSWGARVVLAYAARWPERVEGLLLRSPFLGTAAETRRYIAAWPAWLGEPGRVWLGEALADAAERLYQGATPEALRPGTAGISGSDAGLDERLARVWSAYDDAQSAAGGVAASGLGFEAAKLAPASLALQAAWRVHAHFALQHFGNEPSACLAALDVPVALAWGGRDATCDPAVAAALSASAPHARAHCAVDAGHRMSDPLLLPALLAAAREWVADLQARRSSRLPVR